MCPENGANGPGRTPEDGHHGVADGFDERAFLFVLGLTQDLEMIEHAPERRRITNLAVHACRVAQVGEQNRHTPDVDGFAGPKRFGGEQVAEFPQCDDFRGRERLVAPRDPLDDQ